LDINGLSLADVVKIFPSVSIYLNNSSVITTLTLGISALNF